LQTILSNHEISVQRYGRKLVLILGVLGSGVFGVLRAFSLNYATFASFEFLDSFFGAATYSTAYIIGLELVTPKFRTLVGTLLNCFYAFGEIYLGLIAMWFRNYKTVLLIIYLPSFLIIAYFWILPQSRFEWARKKLLLSQFINRHPMADV
jgi:MFS family permease